MIELRQVVSYLLGLAVVVAILSAGAAYGILEGAQYVPVQPNVSAVRVGSELAIVEPTAVRQGPPVWIAPTPKYNYDPKLMIVRPREERLKEAELKRIQEASRYRAQQEAEKKAQRKIAQQRREQQLREQKNAYALQPEQRPVFNIFSIFQ